MIERTVYNRDDKKMRVHVFESPGEYARKLWKLDKRFFYADDENWSGMGRSSCIRKVERGDMANVKSSDKLLDKMEHLIDYSTSKFEVISTVAGGVPNVPAVLAGIPTNMRLRRRTMSDQAPLSIVCDMVSSGGINADALRKRGVALIALLRALSIVRPVELYFVCGSRPSVERKTENVGVMVRQETSPLDLARIAHMLGEVGCARNLTYGYECYMVNKRGSKNSMIRWPFNDYSGYREQGAFLYAQALCKDPSEVLYMAPPYARDDSISNPEKFIAEMLEKYGGKMVDEAA